MIEPGTVTVAYCHQDEVAFSWHESLLNLVGYDLAHHQRVIRGGWIAMKCGTMGLVQGRNDAVAQFLEGNSEWLFWVDTDMGFAPDTIDKLVEVADPVARPVVGGLAFAQLETAADGMGGYRCEPKATLYAWITRPDGTQGFAGKTRYPPNALVQVAGTGSACILIHRSVLEAIRGQLGPVWYERIQNETSGELQGEDLSFCVRVAAMQRPIFVHTGVRTSHLKHVWLAERDYWSWAEAPPAPDRVDVIVPTMGRPEAAAPFMAALRASTGLATVWAVIDIERDAEAARAWHTAGARIIDSSQDDPELVSTFAEKFNLAYRLTGDPAHREDYLTDEGPAPWMFLVGDDARFTPGWLDHAQAAAEGDRFHIVGTLDNGNPRVMAGEHATHFLIRRSYVDQDGASWDGPGTVCHVGYHHWYNDDEIVAKARAAGVFTVAMGATVDHLHPYFGKGEHDATYAWAETRTEQDRALFEARLEANS
jgi:hypothetical protein